LKKNKPWWNEGLHFSCVSCGRCCRGEPGTVLVTPEEAEAISRRLKKPVGAFTRESSLVGEKVRSLLERPTGECVFLGECGYGCVLYDLRPSQCRLFPFWPSLLSSQEAWERERGRCPGIGKGKWHSPMEIKLCLAQAPHPKL